MIPPASGPSNTRTPENFDLEFGWYFFNQVDCCRQNEMKHEKWKYDLRVKVWYESESKSESMTWGSSSQPEGLEIYVCFMGSYSNGQNSYLKLGNELKTHCTNSKFASLKLS